MHVKKRQIPEAMEEAVYLFDIGDIQGARQIFRTIIKADPNYGEALHFAGLAELRLGDFQASLPLLQSATKKLPRSADCFNSLGVLLRQLDRLKDAKKAL